MPIDPTLLKSILASEGISVTAQAGAKVSPPRVFNNGDWMGYSGAEAWEEDSQDPYLIEFEFAEPVTWRGVPVPVIGGQVIADSTGLFFEVSPEGYEDSYWATQSKSWEPEEAEGALKALARKLASGNLPSGLDFQKA